MRFSLIVATVYRVRDLEALLTSLREQSFQDFDVTLVDQNEDDRLQPIVDEFQPVMNIRRIRSSIRRNAHARNLGMLVATGDIIAFPDDDCIYPPDTLARVDEHFKRDPDLAFLTGPALSHEGRIGPGRWRKASGKIDVTTVWTSITEFNFFVRAQWVKDVAGFDEAFGLGAKFGSAEGIDMVLRIMRLKGRGFYDFDLRVLHPDQGLVPFTVSRAFQYGTGLGRALRKHEAPPGTITTFLIRPIGGALINIVKFNKVAAAYHWQTLRGRLHGFFTPSDVKD
jgi:glycosyltransferase involved in cell wall biosynthesis